MNNAMLPDDPATNPLPFAARRSPGSRNRTPTTRGQAAPQDQKLNYSTN